MTDCQTCLNANPLTGNAAADGTISNCATIACTVLSISYTPPSLPGSMLQFTALSSLTFSEALTTFSSTLNPSNLVPVGVFQLANGVYETPTWNIFSLSATTLQINPPDGLALTSQQFYLRFSEDCTHPLQNEIVAWDP